MFSFILNICNITLGTSKEIELTETQFNAVLGINSKVSAMAGVNFGVSRLLIQYCEKNNIKYRTSTPKLAKLTDAQVLKRTGLKVSDKELKDAIRCFLIELDLNRL